MLLHLSDNRKDNALDRMTKRAKEIEDKKGSNPTADLILKAVTESKNDKGAGGSAPVLDMKKLAETTDIALDTAKDESAPLKGITTYGTAGADDIVGRATLPGVIPQGSPGGKGNKVHPVAEEKGSK